MNASDSPPPHIKHPPPPLRLCPFRLSALAPFLPAATSLARIRIRLRPLPSPPLSQERPRLSYHRDGAAERHRPAQPAGGAREAQAQEEAPRPVPQLILHGCQVPGLFQHVRVLGR